MMGEYRDTPTPAHYLHRRQLAPGITVHVLATGANLMLCWVSMRAGTVLPVHSHPHEQASFVASGRIRWLIDGEERDGPANSGIIFAPNQPHGAVVLEDCVVADSFTPVREDYLPPPAFALLGP
jgi:quercetin dioxygenase-like cupin family protein